MSRLETRGMHSQQGLLAIDDHVEPEELLKGKPAAEAISTELTGELTPSASACEGEEADQQQGKAGGDLTRTLASLQALSLEHQTSLRRKLGAQQSSRCLDEDGSGKDHRRQESGGSGKVEKKGEDAAGAAAAAAAPPADSPIQVVLNKAVLASDMEAATAALRTGADPNHRDANHHTPLHFGAAKGDIGCMRELMRSGARANVANNVGWSPLHYAVLGGHVAAVEALLRAGAYPCFRDNHLISPLHLASTQAGEKETFRRIAELLGPSALLARDELQQTPLHVAASCGNRGAVAVLLDLNADPDAKDRKGRVAGQSFLRQVTRRARADIRAALANAVEERRAAAAAAAAAASAGGDESDGFDDDLPQAKMGMKRASSTASCESAEPVRRPSMLSLLQLGGWGGGGGGGGAEAAGESTFGGGGARPAVASC